MSKQEKVGQKETIVQNIVVEEVGSEYPNSLSVAFVGKKSDKLSMFKVGDLVEVSYNTKAREYNNKYYNSIDGRSITKAKQVAEADDVDDDMPF